MPWSLDVCCKCVGCLKLAKLSAKMFLVVVIVVYCFSSLMLGGGGVFSYTAYEI